MSQKKYNWDPLTDDALAAIEEKFPLAVKTTRKEVYGIIAKLLDCGVEVPGLKLRSGQPPEFIRKAKARLESEGLKAK